MTDDLFGVTMEVKILSCYHPLKAWQIGVNPSGKPHYKITSYDCDYIDCCDYGSGRTYVCCHGTPVHHWFTIDLITDFIEIPCGQCIGCRLDYSRQWADRCMLELQDHKSSYFVTLTYDDDHVPFTFTSDSDTGECEQMVLTLRKRDFQLFMKRLRKALPEQKLRYFAAGEYGSETFRPHYHAIIFGLELNDLRLYKRALNAKYSYYNSATLEKVWPFGHVVVGKVTWETCAYTARYIMKKQKGTNASVYSDFNIEPEFSLMSRKPGIARNYYEQNKSRILLR